MVASKGNLTTQFNQANIGGLIGFRFEKAAGIMIEAGAKLPGFADLMKKKSLLEREYAVGDITVEQLEASVINLFKDCGGKLPPLDQDALEVKPYLAQSPEEKALNEMMPQLSKEAPPNPYSDKSPEEKTLDRLIAQCSTDLSP